MSSREALYRLIDLLPANVLPEAERFLAGLQHDPVLRAFGAASLVSDPLSPELQVAIEEGEAELARGETVPWRIVQVRVFGGS